MFHFFVIVLSFFHESNCEEFDYIFRDSALLHEVQLRKVFDSPEYFLRLKLLKPQREILQDFRELKLFQIPIPKRKKILKEFVDENFENTTSLDPWVPPDFKNSLKLLKKVRDADLYRKLKSFNLVWLRYGRKLTDEVTANPERYSFIPVPRPFFVCSDVQQEMGYWESFWIFQGLMACDMVESAKNIMENIFSIVEKLGYCPPYNRVYYRGRTSPPMLPFMMSSYLERTNDTDYLSRHVSGMDSDLTTWTQQRLALLESPFHAFFIVVDEWWPQIRPECYREDVLSILKDRKKDSGPREMFWQVEDGVLQTSVLLTAVTEASARLLAPWLREFGYKAKARYLENVSREMNYTLQNLLRVGDCWRDLHVDEGYREESALSLAPLWTGTTQLPCEAAKLTPAASGPEAVLASEQQALRWLSRLCKVKVDSLVDIACAFHIVRTTADLSLEHSEEVEPARAKPVSWVLMVAIVTIVRQCMAFRYK